jgi:hypothetical protein
MAGRGDADEGVLVEADMSDERLTAAEAERAFDGAPEVPLSDERIREIVAYATGSPAPVADRTRLIDPEPVWYWLEGGERTPAVRYAIGGGLSFLVVDLRTPEGRKVIGQPNWFAADYVEHWRGSVPECCEEGTGPGCWSK